MSILTAIGDSSKPHEGEEFLAPDEGLQLEFPGLYEFLARFKVGGKDRKPGKLIVYFEPGRINLCLSDAHTGQVAFHVGDSLQEALEAVEARLQAGKMDWRKSRKWQG